MMGRTVPSFRQALNREIASWGVYKRALSPADQSRFDKVMIMARKHADASSIAARPVMSEAVFMSALLSLLELVETLQDRVNELESRDSGADSGAIDAEKKDR